jgi:DNA-binding NtrC family response regulator
MKILILDDVPEYLNSLSRALASEHEVATAATLEEAKQKLDETIGLAVLDVRLSEDDIANRDGIQLLGYLKQQYPQLPVVMMSAYRDFDAATEALNLGASYYLKKPINLRELKDLITTLGTGSK